MEKLYKNRDWLWEHYIAREESMSVMARKAECGRTTICRYLRELDTPIRDYRIDGLGQDRDWLYEHYIVREESSPTMAKEAGCDYNTILYHLRKNNIPVRSRGEGVFLAERNSVNITPDLLEFMEGEILGDGHMEMRSKYSAHYSHGSKYEEYLIWLSGCYDAWGIEQVGRITRHKNKQNGGISYNYASKSYPELVPVRKRWYPNGKRIVPKDLKLTPIIARQWYLGDGHLKNSGPSRPSITLGTCSLDQQSIRHLIKELGRLGFKATRRPASNTIGIWVRSVKDFLEWIGPCPISCYNYKWDYERRIS